jgi:hypothetical protein
MKIKSKIAALSTTSLILLIVAAIIMTAAGALIITSNTLDFAPKDKPTILLSSNSTNTPYVGDTVQFTAVITPKPASPVPVTFYINANVFGTVNTINGLATYNYEIPTNGGFTGHATATIP